MTDEDDKFWRKVAKDLARRSGFAPLTPQEAQKAFEALPDAKLSEFKIESIIGQVTSEGRVEVRLAAATDPEVEQYWLWRPTGPRPPAAANRLRVGQVVPVDLRVEVEQRWSKTAPHLRAILLADPNQRLWQWLARSRFRIDWEQRGRRGKTRDFAVASTAYHEQHREQQALMGRWVEAEGLRVAEQDINVARFWGTVTSGPRQ